jgi:hypothetical protein
MKFMLQWTPRSNGTGPDNLADLQRILDTFAKWEGFGDTVQVSEWVLSLAPGERASGWLICTTDDSEALMKACYIWEPWLNFVLTPVIDVQAGAAVMGEAALWTRTQL